MNDCADTIFTQTLPEMLARDLAKSERLFLTSTLTAGAPSSSLASEGQTPEVPQRNPGRAATKTLHRATSETTLCLQQAKAGYGTDTARKRQCGRTHKDAGSWYRSNQDQRQDNMTDDRYAHMSEENDNDKAILALKGLDDGWGSDSSADVEAGRSSPSVRVRKQSVTTAGTSVEAPSFIGIGVGRVGCASPTQSLDKRDARMPHMGGESWVDLGPDMTKSEEDVSRAGALTRPSDYTDWANTQPALLSDEEEPEQLTFVNVPRRRSSLSHQVTTVILGESAHAHLSSAHPTVSQGPASQVLLPSPQATNHHHLAEQYQHPQNWDNREAAASPIVPTSPRHAIRKPGCALRTTLQNQQLQSPSPCADPSFRFDSLDSIHQKRQQPTLFNRLRKTQSHSKMHVRTHVQTWLDSSATTPSGLKTFANPASPTGMASLASIRVPVEVLENLRISVGNFPDTMLRTSSLTVQTIRSYSRKLKRGGVNNERALTRDSNEIAFDARDWSAPALGRQPSLGNLKLKKLSLRGRLNLTSRLTASPTSPNPREDGVVWRNFESHQLSTRPETPLSRKSHSEVSACVAALRSIFPNGTDYLLDALYAHIIAYNYINSLCGGLPHLQNDGGHRGLRARPSMNFAVPLGVTSRADLKLQDPEDSAIQEFQDDVASVASTAIFPKKAASLLGLGDTNMGKPVKPHSGTLGGRRAKYRKTTPPAASFSASLESESAMRDLRDTISANIHRLVATMKEASFSASKEESDEDGEDGILLGTSAKDLDPTLLRAICEVVRCYEELS